MRAFWILLAAVVLAIGVSMTPSSAARSSNNDIYLQAGERFTVVCTGGSVMVYGDNGTPDQPTTGVAGYCASAK